MLFVATVVLTFVVVLVALLYFWVFGAPVYRVESANVIRLLELVVSEEATESDWQVFMAYPIRNNEMLARVQQRCFEIAEREYLGSGSRLFSRKGVDELAIVLQELKDEVGEG